MDETIEQTKPTLREKLEAMFAPGAPPVEYIKRIDNGSVSIWASGDLSEFLSAMRATPGFKFADASEWDEETQRVRITIKDGYDPTSAMVAAEEANANGEG